MTRRCKCEHWQVCPVCAPQMFDGDGNLLPPEPTPLEAAKQEIKRLRAELAEAQRDAERYRFIRDADQADGRLEFDSILCYSMDSLDEAVDAAIDRVRGAE